MIWWPYAFALLGIFTVVTMWAVVVTEGCRKTKLQYYGFKLASAARYSNSFFLEKFLFITIVSCCDALVPCHVKQFHSIEGD